MVVKLFINVCTSIIVCFCLGMDIDSAVEPTNKQSLTKKNLKLTFDEYKRITNMLVVYMRSEEEKRIAGTRFIFTMTKKLN